MIYPSLQMSWTELDAEPLEQLVEEKEEQVEYAKFFHQSFVEGVGLPDGATNVTPSLPITYPNVVKDGWWGGYLMNLLNTQNRDNEANKASFHFIFQVMLNQNK